MSVLHYNLKKHKHLKNGGRLQYGLFLKAIGLSVQDSLTFWRSYFTKKMSLDEVRFRFIVPAWLNEWMNVFIAPYREQNNQLPSQYTLLWTILASRNKVTPQQIIKRIPCHLSPSNNNFLIYKIIYKNQVSVTKLLLRNGLTDSYEILFVYSVGLKIGRILFVIPLSDKDVFFIFL